MPAGYGGCLTIMEGCGSEKVDMKVKNLKCSSQVAGVAVQLEWDPVGLEI